MNPRIPGVLLSFAIFLAPCHAGPAAFGTSSQEAAIDWEVADLKTDLLLTPAQEAATRAAMEGAVYHQTGVKTVDQTFHEILQPDQLAEWEVIKRANLTADANSSATLEVDRLAPQLGLSYAQKKRLHSALFQAGMKAPGERGLVWEDAELGVLTSSQQLFYRQQIAQQGRWAATFNQNNPALAFSFNFPPSTLTLNGSSVH